MVIKNLDELAKDFLVAFEEAGKNAHLSPMQLMQRWHKKEYALPKGMDLHTILVEFIPRISKRAFEIKEVEDNA
jgi:hypothetical protein